MNKEKDKEKKNKKERKLLIQIGAAVVPAFIVMIFAVLLVVYNSTVDSFLEAKNTAMTEKLEDCTKYGLGEFGGFIAKYWREHADTVTKDYTQQEEAKFFDHLKDKDLMSQEWFESQTDEVRSYCAKLMYKIMLGSFDDRIDNQEFNSIFMVDISNDNRGFLYYYKDSENNTRKLGEKIDIDISKHKVLQQLLETGSTETVFEKAADFPADGNYYIGYQLVAKDDDSAAVLGITYDWTDFRKSLNKTFSWAFLICVAVMLAVMTILSVMLYRKAIKPIEIIQKGVRTYIRTKDSSRVEADMAKVKTRNELDSLSGNITALASSIDHYTAENIRLAKQQQQVAYELDLAKTIQESLLPGDFPAFPERSEFDIYASMTPAKQVGGDLYDFFLVDDDHLGLVIADVSDKGMPAALYMMVAKVLINNFATMGLAPHEVLERTNEALCRNNKHNMFVTVWMGVLEISTGKITASNAGHEYPIIKQPGGKFELFKDDHGFVVGAVEGMQYTDYEFTLPKGAALFVYTDGVVEARNADDEMYDVQRLIDYMNTLPDLPPAQLLESIHAHINEFVGDAPQFDDLTMLGLTLS